MLRSGLLSIALCLTRCAHVETALEAVHGTGLRNVRLGGIATSCVQAIAGNVDEILEVRDTHWHLQVTVWSEVQGGKNDVMGPLVNIPVFSKA